MALTTMQKIAGYAIITMNLESIISLINYLFKLDKIIAITQINSTIKL